ncbi:MAG: aldolase/citrate lyase family protein [Alphaproteobacteria bacterium]
MRANEIKRRWQAGEACVNGWCAIPNSFSAELMAHAGWDSITIDLQHGLVDYQAAVTMLQAISTTATPPTARVPWCEPGIIMKMLDAGAMGIICPMINTPEEAETFVGACKYAPLGYRSSGPTRAVIYSGSDSSAKANDEILAIAMIETVQAVENLDAILATPGLDGVYIGPTDLALTMGAPPVLDPTDKGVVAAIEKIIDATNAKGLGAGIHCGTPEYAAKMIKRGAKLTTIASDGRLLALAAAAAVKACKGVTAEQKPAGPGSAY